MLKQLSDRILGSLECTFPLSFRTKTVFVTFQFHQYLVSFVAVDFGLHMSVFEQDGSLC